MTSMAIPTKDIAELRARTGAGMMDCKKALEEASGEMEKAVELLRAKGIAKAEKRTGRSTSQGLVLGQIAPGARAGTLVALTCETDFVARNEAFGALAERVLARAAAAGASDLASFLSQPAAEGSLPTMAEFIKEASGKTGEAVNLAQVASYTPVDGIVGSYLHFNKQVGVLVEMTGAGTSHEAAHALARDIALHVASADPLSVRSEDVPTELVDRERRIAEEQVTAEGKPETVRSKIVEGKIRKFLAERSLMDQPFVKDDTITIGALVAAAAATAGGPLIITRFVRFKIGEA